MPVYLEATDSFAKTVQRLRKLSATNLYFILDSHGPEGVSALRAGTPIETGETANSWYYEITPKGESYEISWNNSHVINGANVALLLHYGHGTGTGGYVAGRPYLVTAMAPVFARILLDVRKAVAT